MFSSPPHPRKTLTLLAVLPGHVLLIIDVQIVVVALPSIRAASAEWAALLGAGHRAAAALIAACIAFTAGALAIVLIRRQDFHTPGPAAPQPAPATANRN